MAKTKSTSKTVSTPLVQIYEEKVDLRKTPPPLLHLQVSNPLVYLKNWWSRVIGNEGIDFRFRVHPLTAIALTIIIATFGFGVGRFAFISDSPYIKYIPQVNASPSPSPLVWRETAFSGTLHGANGNYYLVTANAEAITLLSPANVNLKSLIGRRIFATGSYNDQTRELRVTDASDMEILPKKIEEVPTTTSSAQMK